jgi:hypothetical protein
MNQNMRAGKRTGKQTSSSLSASAAPRLWTPTTRAMSFWKGLHDFVILEYCMNCFLEKMTRKNRRK